MTEQTTPAAAAELATCEAFDQTMTVIQSQAEEALAALRVEWTPDAYRKVAAEIIAELITELTRERRELMDDSPAGWLANFDA